jgi:uncharacterized protein (DUF2147 family)
MKLLLPLTIILSITLWPLETSSPLVNADEVLGIYWSPKKDGKIQIYKRNNKYYGKTIWGIKDRKDTLNPDPKLRSNKIVGLEFLRDFVFDEDEWVDGTVYDPESGKTYSCKMWLDNGDVMLKGYIGISIIGRSEKLEKVR